MNRPSGEQRAADEFDHAGKPMQTEHRGHAGPRGNPISFARPCSKNSKRHHDAQDGEGVRPVMGDAGGQAAACVFRRVMRAWSVDVQQRESPVSSWPGRGIAKAAILRTSQKHDRGSLARTAAMPPRDKSCPNFDSIYPGFVAKNSPDSSTVTSALLLHSRAYRVTLPATRKRGGVRRDKKLGGSPMDLHPHGAEIAALTHADRLRTMRQ